jgi:hypothetical protein
VQVGKKFNKLLLIEELAYLQRSKMVDNNTNSKLIAMRIHWIVLYHAHLDIIVINLLTFSDGKTGAHHLFN